MDTSQGFSARMEIIEVVELCYARGFRDKNLVTMIAIVGAETNFDPTFNDGSKFGLVGLHPNDKNKEFLMDPTYSSLVARERYERSFFAPWVTYATGAYYNFIKQSIAGVSELYLKMFEAELKV